MTLEAAGQHDKADASDRAEADWHILAPQPQAPQVVLPSSSHHESAQKENTISNLPPLLLCLIAAAGGQRD